MKIEDIDTNFKPAECCGQSFIFTDFSNPVFEVKGFGSYEKEKIFCRLPAAILPECSAGVRQLAYNTSGGRLLFRTDSSSIALKAEVGEKCNMSHMPRSGSSGFDLYERNCAKPRFLAAAIPTFPSFAMNTILVENMNPGMHDYTVNFPLYDSVKSLSIGVLPGAGFEKPSPMKLEKPILFYGSSITQGGCASRPGNAYSHILGRRLDADILNLGFSGSARGEAVIAKYIAGLELSAFVMDYDWNSQTPETLERTHEAFFRIIRNAQPELPVIFISRCDIDFYKYCGDANLRFSIIEKTYKKALASGDKNVYLINGGTLFGTEDREQCTVDGIHPNDLGFMRMAENIFPTLKKALGID